MRTVPIIEMEEQTLDEWFEEKKTIYWEESKSISKIKLERMDPHEKMLTEGQSKILLMTTVSKPSQGKPNHGRLFTPPKNRLMKESNEGREKRPM
jgi:hypothetical protein